MAENGTVVNDSDTGKNTIQESSQTVDKDEVKIDAEKQKKEETASKPSVMKTALLLSFGSVAVVLGAVAAVFWQPIFMAQLRKMMILTNDSYSFSLWREIPIPMYLECFMLNITNVDDILAKKNVSIQVEQLGPYVFKESHTKVDIDWNDNGTVTFFNERFWHYQPEMSNGSLSDMVTSINPIIATVAYTVRHQRAFVRVAVDVMLRMYHDNLFLSANVSSWLFDGIDDPILDVAEHFPNLPINIPYDKFGWFYSRNGSKEYDGIFVMNTGINDFSRLGMVEMWRHSNQSVYRDECGEVRGSTGELWAPELRQDEVEVFAPDICTYMTLSKNKTVNILDIEGVEYSANYSLFDNGYHYPRKECYCAEIRDADCLPAGALNVSQCRYGAPAFVSLPHFLHTDPYYPSKIDGLAPTDEHNFRLSLEMFTGIPLSVDAQLQINLLVRHIDGITINNQLPDNDVLVPMFWFRQEVRITPDLARQARLALTLHRAVPYAFYAVTAIGVILLSLGTLVLVRRLMYSPDTTPILSEQHEED